MIKIISILIIVSLIPSVAVAACTGATPTWSCTNDLTSIANCISGVGCSGFQPEDTISVSAGVGTVTWGYLAMPTGVKLIGPGSANLTVTVGTCGGGAPSGIEIKPIASDTNYATRISGFTFSLVGEDCLSVINLYPYSAAATQQTKLRIDHNVFIRTSTGTHAIHAWNPSFYGVVDNNVFTDFAYPVRSPQSTDNGKYQWENRDPVIFGAKDNNLYYEDNVFTGVSFMMTDCQYGGRYAVRYNTVSGTAESNPLFDMHGNYLGAYSCFGGEVYGNDLTFSHAGYMMQQRGGRGLWFLNNINTDASYARGDIEEEEYDNINPVTDCIANANPYTCCTGSGVGVNCVYPGMAGKMDPHDIYIWGSRKNLTTALSAASSGSLYGTTAPVENVSWWQDNFVGCTKDACASGVGCGSAVPTGTCTTGVGYWATDQSCSDLTGMVGKSPATKISGTLYKCTATNTWTSYYTPYEYPHPLRNESGQFTGSTTGSLR